MSITTLRAVQRVAVPAAFSLALLIVGLAGLL